MWEYKHTDEMYTGRFDRSEKLFHSDVYLGQDFSDGIRHWKYIKREKVNGKWRYYYHDEDLNKAKKEYDRNSEAITYENLKRGYAKDKKEASNKIVYMHKGKEVKDATYRKLGTDVLGSSINYTLKKQKSDKRKKRYEKVPIKALNAMSNVGYNIRKKINKGKKAIAKLFKKKKKK